jgi:hypothetical protein
MSSSGTCANCGASLAGPYCHACGQPESASHPATLGHLGHELTHELLHVDGKIWRTARSLFLQPGELTAEYWAGRRARWIGPFRVFLIAAAALLFVPGIGPMNFQTRLERSADGALNVAIGAPRAQTPGTTLVEGSERDAYVGRLRTAYSAVRYAAVPLFALCTWLLYRRAQPYFASHLVLAVHFYSVWYLVSVVTARLPYQAGAITGMTVSGIYLFRMLRRLFASTRLRTVPKALVLYVVMLALEMALALAAGTWVARSLA